MDLRAANWFRAQSLDITLGFPIYLTPWISHLFFLICFSHCVDCLGCKHNGWRWDFLFLCLWPQPCTMIQLVRMPGIPVIPFSRLCLVTELNSWKLIFFLLAWDCTDLNEIKKKIKLTPLVIASLCWDSIKWGRNFYLHFYFSTNGACAFISYFSNSHWVLILFLSLLWQQWEGFFINRSHEEKILKAVLTCPE